VPDEALVQQIVAERLQAQLDGAKLRKKRPEAANRWPSRWQHVPVQDLLAEHNPPARVQSDGTLRSGHQPFHGSKSGECLTYWPESGRWYCSSCKKAGDAATWLQQLRGCSYQEAAAWLTERYGAPPGGRR
jgi:hypothetical protein